jgi:sterol-4alpha-carboxylate 3-dehydrogenase (decarboxylating)
MDGITKLLSPFVTLHPSITRFRVTVINGNRYYDTSKAKRLLGYKPIVELMEGFKLTADYWKGQGFGIDLKQ